jgi:hypothetical protein
MQFNTSIRLPKEERELFEPLLPERIDYEDGWELHARIAAAAQKELDEEFAWLEVCQKQGDSLESALVNPSVCGYGYDGSTLATMALRLKGVLLKYYDPCDDEHFVRFNEFDLEDL